MKKYVITGAVCFMIGVIVTGIGGYFLFFKQNIPEGSIQVEQISGEKIDHEKWNFRGNKISFHTKSEGKGEIKTDIPKTLIPEADAWMNKNTAIGLMISEKYVPDIKLPVTGIGISFYKRWRSVDFGGGPLVEFTTESNPKFYSLGVFIEARYWFKLPGR